MIVVDTSVWIDVLNGVDSPAATACIRLIEAGEPVALTDIVFAEILQGLRDEHDAAQVQLHLRAFPILRLQGLRTSLSRRRSTGPPAARASPSARRSIA